MKNHVGWKFATMISLVTCALFVATPARAKLAISTANGWEFSTDGFINAFAIYEDSEAKPANVTGGTLEDSNKSAFRIRTGLLPGLIAFNIKAPTTNGIDLSSRVGFYPQIQNDQSKDGRQSFSSQIDLREAYLQADGKFGQFLAGRALHLYQGKNILNDMTLFGAGVQGGVSGGGTTLGYIGYGYVYTNFGAQLKYTTPDFAGFKIALSLNDPSPISDEFKYTDRPDYEGEISYAAKLGGMDLQAWVNAMDQDAENAAGDSVTADGVAAGVGVDVIGIHALVSGWTGKANGPTLLLSGGIDSAGKEIDGNGFLANITYNFISTTKIGFQYGQNSMDETTAQKAAREAGDPASLDTQKAWTVGIYHDLTKNFKVMAEYTNAKNEWFNGADQESKIYSIGTFFIW
jgi:hypothetical protein